MNFLIWIPPALSMQDIWEPVKKSSCDGLFINIKEIDTYDDVIKPILPNFPKSILSLGTGDWENRFSDYKDLLPCIDKYYIGEPYSTYYKNQIVWDTVQADKQLMLFGQDKFLIDEPSLVNLLKHKANRTYNVAYSSYRQYWVWLEKLSYFLGSKTGWRIPRFGNQIWAWEWLKNNFGGTPGYTYEQGGKLIDTQYLGNRFNYCWVNLTMNSEDFEPLLKWCKENNKRVLLFVEWDLTKEQFLSAFETFTNIIEKI